MARITIELPSLLRDAVNDSPVTLEADTIDRALRALVRRHPSLEARLLDEAGTLRPHVLCFHNGANTRWLPSLDATLADGDTLTILQAVSGG